MLHPLSSGSPGTESTQIYNPILQLTQACDFNIMGDWDGDSFLSLSLSHHDGSIALSPQAAHVQLSEGQLHDGGHLLWS